MKLFLIFIFIFLIAFFSFGTNTKLTTCITCNECYAIDCSKLDIAEEKADSEKSTLICYDSLLKAYKSYDISDLKNIFEIDLDRCLIVPCCSYFVK